MNCPQCGTGLGEGAGTCAACGWKKSNRTVWIVLGAVVGGLCLICCGIGTWFVFKIQGIVAAKAGEIVPIQALVLRAQVVNFAKKHGKPPATLAEAQTEPFVNAEGEEVKVEFVEGDSVIDVWARPFRLTMAEDRTFEVRSAGVDGTFDNADDVVEKGSLDDDPAALMKEIEARGERLTKSRMFSPRLFFITPVSRRTPGRSVRLLHGFHTSWA